MNLSLQHLLWSTAGLAVGAGLFKKVMSVTIAKGRRRYQWPPTNEQIIGVLVIAVAIVSGALYVQQSRELEHTINCQTHLNEQFRDALQARSEAAGQQNQTTLAHLEAEKTYLVTLTQTPDTVGRREATDDFLRRLDERIEAVRLVEQTRVSNPLPELESCH